jgi:hypothetical protein
MTLRQPQKKRKPRDVKKWKYNSNLGADNVHKMMISTVKSLRKSSSSSEKNYRA